MGNHCHCLAPAGWLLRIVRDGDFPGAHAVAAWASCDEHIAEAARQLVTDRDMTGKHLDLRAEPIN